MHATRCARGCREVGVNWFAWYLRGTRVVVMLALDVVSLTMTMYVYLPPSNRTSPSLIARHHC